MGTELRIEQLSAGYGRHDVLRRLSCSFPAGILSAVLGPNGAGKTSLLRALCGYLPVRSGTALLDGNDLLSLSPRERARSIAFVPQLAGELAPLTVSEAVLLARYPHAQQRFSSGTTDRQIADEALAALGLSDSAGRYCGELSGGELRRVLVAQGLAQAPRVLLLDEPSAFLDPPAQHEILAIARELARERGLIVVAILHDPRLAALYAEHVLLLRDGAALAEGSPGETLDGRLLAEVYDCSPDSLAIMEAVR